MNEIAWKPVDPDIKQIDFKSDFWPESIVSRTNKQGNFSFMLFHYEVYKPELGIFVPTVMYTRIMSQWKHKNAANITKHVL